MNPTQAGQSGVVGTRSTPPGFTEDIRSPQKGPFWAQTNPFCLFSRAGWFHMTHFKLEVMIHCQGVSKIVTANRISPIIFPSYHLIEQICSFPTMYNTWGGVRGVNFVKQTIFSQKVVKKHSFWRSWFRIFWLRSGLRPTIFEVSLSSTSVLKKVEHQLRYELCARRQSSKLSDWRPLENFFGVVMKKC